MKLKNNNNTTQSIDYSHHIPNNFATGIMSLKNLDLSIKSCSDDASNEAESVDSGCVPDLTPETSWLQVSSTLKYEYNFISELLQHTLSKSIPASNTSQSESSIPNGDKIIRSSDVMEKSKKKKDKKAMKDAKKEQEKVASTSAGIANEIEAPRFDVGLKMKLESELRRLKSGKRGDLSVSQANTREMKIKKKLLVMEKKREKGLKRMKRQQNVINNSLNKQASKGNKKIYNNSGQLVYSKFDFSEGAKEKWEENKKRDLNYYMSKVIKEKEKVKSLQSQGNVSEAIKCLEKNAWNKAMKKAQGEKVKDDVQKLKKSLDKKQQKKKRSQAKWNERVSNTKKQQETRQEKRKQNIASKKEKRQQKSKGKKKKGGKGSRVPGF